MTKPCILVVDNEAIIAKGIETKLRRAGYHVPAIALSGQDAIEQAALHKPDLILMDIVMEGGMDGMEAATRINNQQDIPIIYVTAHENDEFIQRAANTGPYGYLIKPIEINDLRSAIEIALHKHATEKKLKLQLRRIQVMREIDEVILSNLGLRATLTFVVEAITRALQADLVQVLLEDASHQALVYIAGCVTSGAQINPGLIRSAAVLAGRTYRPGEGLAGMVAERRLPVQLNIRAASGDPVDPYGLQELGFCSYLGIPLMSQSSMRGVLEIWHNAPLPEDGAWLEFAQALARQVTIAVENASLLENLHNANDELARAYDATIEGWSRTLEMRDFETLGHSQRVTDLTMRLARALGVPDSELRHLRWGAQLHDIGKMGVPDSILHKPGPLNMQEWETMRQHPRYAYQMLSEIPFLKEACLVAYSHHEKWDGSGYPRGLRALEIPLYARIFAVADVWEALSSDRPYRKAWPVERIREYLREQAGKHFDPHMVEVFFQMQAIEGQ